MMSLVGTVRGSIRTFICSKTTLAPIAMYRLVGFLLTWPSAQVVLPEPDIYSNLNLNP